MGKLLSDDISNNISGKNEGVIYHNFILCLIETYRGQLILDYI